MWLYYIVPAVCPEACWYVNSSLVSLKTKSCQNYTISTALRKGKGRLTAHALLQVKVLCPFQESSGYLPLSLEVPVRFTLMGVLTEEFSWFTYSAHNNPSCFGQGVHHARF